VESSKVNVQLSDSKGAISAAELVFSTIQPWRMTLHLYGGREIVSTERDLFACMQKIRVDLEANGDRLLCNGARQDVYPSGMSRDMSGGLVAYVLTIGKRTTREDLVRITDFAPLEKTASVQEQEEFHKRWVASIV
jgi:hypothetical protein